MRPAVIDGFADQIGFLQPEKFSKGAVYALIAPCRVLVKNRGGNGFQQLPLKGKTGLNRRFGLFALSEIQHRCQQKLVILALNQVQINPNLAQFAVGSPMPGLIFVGQARPSSFEIGKQR